MVTVPPPCISALSSRVASTWASPPGSDVGLQAAHADDDQLAPRPAEGGLPLDDLLLHDLVDAGQFGRGRGRAAGRAPAAGSPRRRGVRPGPGRRCPLPGPRRGRRRRRSSPPAAWTARSAGYAAGARRPRRARGPPRAGWTGAGPSCPARRPPDPDQPTPYRRPSGRGSPAPRRPAASATSSTGWAIRAASSAASQAARAAAPTISAATSGRRGRANSRRRSPARERRAPAPRPAATAKLENHSLLRIAHCPG